METAGPASNDRRGAERLVTVEPERALEAETAPPLPSREIGPGVTWRSVLLSLLLMPVSYTHLTLPTICSV